MKLDASIFIRVPRALKRKVVVEAKRRQRDGQCTNEADIAREAIIQYFQAREVAAAPAMLSDLNGQAKPEVPA